jgi:hypothetical protein
VSAAYKLHPVVLRIFPLPTTTEIERTKERVALYKRHGVIEAVGNLIVTGFVEYSACKELGVVPKVTAINEPHDIIEYIVRRNLPPADYDDNARGCVAVLAHKQSSKTLAKERVREGGRRGGQNKGKGRDQIAQPFGGDGERWFQLAAKTVGVRPGLVRSLDRLLSRAPDVFAMVREKRIEKVHRAHEFVKKLPDPADRETVLKRYEAAASFNRKTRLLDLAHEHLRAKERAMRPAGTPKGRSYVVHTGAMLKRADMIPDGSVDIVFADIVYGRSKMAAEASMIAAKKLVPGGYFVLMCGHDRYLDSVNAAARHMTPLDAVGFIDLPDARGGALREHRPMRDVDDDPVFFFVPNGTRPHRQIARLRYRSEMLDKRFHRWGKPLDAMTSLLASLIQKDSGAVVADLCCGGGGTGEPALRLGCEFIGIDIDPQAANDTAARLAKVEEELAAGEVTRILDTDRMVPPPEGKPGLRSLKLVPSRPGRAHAKPHETAKAASRSRKMR